MRLETKNRSSRPPQRSALFATLQLALSTQLSLQNFLPSVHVHLLALPVLILYVNSDLLIIINVSKCLTGNKINFCSVKVY